MRSDELQKHIFSIHLSLRVAMVALGLAFPVILWVGGEIQGIHLQSSMSAYYYASANGHSMHDWFVGMLFATGAFLYLYKGFSKEEDWVLSLGGMFAIGIAIYPTSWNCAGACDPLTTHDAFSMLFSICMAYVCVFRASDTLHLLDDAALIRKFRMLYRIIGVVIVAAPAMAALQTLVLRQFRPYTYYSEVAAVWTFAVYWAVKSAELGVSRAEHLALQGLVRGAQVPAGTYVVSVKAEDRQ